MASTYSALEARREAARQAAEDRYADWHGRLPNDVAMKPVNAAIETATRVTITPEIVAAVHRPGTSTDEDALRAAFEAAGFEVTE